MKTHSVTRIFIPFLIILGGAVTSVALITLQLTSATLLPGLLLSFIILVGGAGLFFVILKRAFHSATPPDNQKPACASLPQGLEQLKASYTAAMSHELRTQLNAIIGFTGVILQGVSGETISSRQRDQLERVQDAAKRLLSMITDIIDIAKIDAGSAGFFPSSFDLNAAIEESVMQMSGDNQQHFSKVSLDVDVPHQLLIHTDKKKLQQCIINLLICVVEYTDTKNITIAADKSGDHLNIFITVSKQDQGQNSLADLIRAPKTKKREAAQKVECNKIRLYLTMKMITELLGGSISVDTESGNKASLQIGFDANSAPGSRQREDQG